MDMNIDIDIDTEQNPALLIPCMGPYVGPVAQLGQDILDELDRMADRMYETIESPAIIGRGRTLYMCRTYGNGLVYSCMWSSIIKIGDTMKEAIVFNYGDGDIAAIDVCGSRWMPSIREAHSCQDGVVRGGRIYEGLDCIDLDGRPLHVGTASWCPQMDDWITLYKWVERGIWCPSVTAVEALRVLAFYPNAAWKKVPWDVSHKDYGDRMWDDLHKDPVGAITKVVSKNR